MTAPVYKLSPLSRRGGSRLVHVHLVGRRRLAETGTLAFPHWHTYRRVWRHDKAISCAVIGQRIGHFLKDAEDGVLRENPKTRKIVVKTSKPQISDISVYISCIGKH